MVGEIGAFAETMYGELGPSGFVAFGRQTDQTFDETRSAKDASIIIEPFVVELRLKK